MLILSMKVKLRVFNGSVLPTGGKDIASYASILQMKYDRWCLP